MEFRLLGLTFFLVLIVGCVTQTPNVSPVYNLGQDKENGVAIFSLVFPGGDGTEKVFYTRNLFGGESGIEARRFNLELFIFSSENESQSYRYFDQSRRAYQEIFGTDVSYAKRIKMSGQKFLQDELGLKVPGGRLIVIKLPKGNYQIGRWKAISVGFQVVRYISPSGIYVKEFKIFPRKATYLGQITVSLFTPNNLITEADFYKRDINLLLKTYKKIQEKDIIVSSSRFKHKLIVIGRYMKFLSQCKFLTSYDTKFFARSYSEIRKNHKTAIEYGGNILLFQQLETSFNVSKHSFSIYKCDKEIMKIFN